MTTKLTYKTNDVENLPVRRPFGWKSTVATLILGGALFAGLAGEYRDDPTAVYAIIGVLSLLAATTAVACVTFVAEYNKQAHDVSSLYWKWETEAFEVQRLNTELDELRADKTRGAVAIIDLLSIVDRRQHTVLMHNPNRVSVPVAKAKDWLARRGGDAA